MMLLLVVSSIITFKMLLLMLPAVEVILVVRSPLVSVELYVFLLILGLEIFHVFL